MFNTKAACLSAIIFLGGINITKAQDTSNTIGHVSIASPTAASLGKYGDIPVSYNTGIPQVSIPIYTVQSGSLKLPVGLSYHASGLKVQENASWVGAGWSLNAGGVITRTVAGAADDRGVASYTNVTNGHYSDYGFNSYQFVSGSGFGSVHGMVSDDQGFEQGAKDGEPDLYFFNFGGYSGKFYFNDDRTPILVPEQDFKIVPDLVLGSGNFGFQGFTVTTPDGVKYYFGKTGNNSAVAPFEITTPGTVQNGYASANAAVSSWFLNKVVSSDGMDSITLGYQQEYYSYFTLAMNPVLSPSYNPTDIANCGYNLVKNFVTGVRLSQINFPNGTVVFTPAASPRTDLAAGYNTNSGMTDVNNVNSYALGSISVSNASGFCKKDSFYYGYFNDPNSLTIHSAYNVYSLHSDAYRLRLDSVQESSCNAGLKVPPYKFSYFSELVPRKLSFGMDHWGFSNGVTGNAGLVPTYTVNSGISGALTYVNGANRDPAWPAMRGGSLQQINYPTGGNTQFTFEANDTYVNYSTYTKIQRRTIAVGYDGSTYDSTSFTTGTVSDTWEVDISSNSSTGNDNLQIACGGNYNIVGNTTPITAYFTPAPNINCHMDFYGSGNLTGTGATATIYEYVPTAVSGNIMVGGLRIKSITNNDAITPTNITTSYVYTNGGAIGGQTSGILYSRPVYVQTIRNDITALVYGPFCSTNGCESCNNNGSVYYVSPASVTPMSTVQGNHVGYNEVHVFQDNNGSSVYRYYGSGMWDNIISDVCVRIVNTATCSLTIPNFPAPPDPFEYTRGDLKYEGQYNQAGQILKDATYTYTYQPDPIQTPAIKFITIPSLYSYTMYSLQSAKKTQTSVVSTSYDPANANAVTTTNRVYYASNFHHEPTRQVSFTSTGDSLITNTKYAFDFRITSCDAIPDSLTYYNNAVHADSILLTTEIATCTFGAGWTCRYDTLQDFRRNINLARQQYITYRRRSYSDPGNLLSACYVSALPAADTLLKPVLRLQNMYENAPVEVSSWKNANLLHASFTRYDTSLSPIGFAYPGRTKLINLQAPSASFTNASVSSNTIAKDSRYIDESFYNFTNGNPVQVLGHDGVANAYIWDYLNTQPIAKVTNATIDQAAYTSFEADGKGGWTFAGTPATDASAPTGGKCYSLASGSVSKSGLTSATQYVVSYWSKTGSSFTVTGSTAVKQGKTINGWTYFEHTATGATTITVSGSGSIDELRLYPSTAQMTTYAYTPLLGMTSECDVNNRITYYFYDLLGRLKWVKDQDLNILKTIQYHYQTVTGIFY